MDFQFTVGPVTLDQDEAEALLKENNGQATITVDLLKSVDRKLLNATNLFNRSVESRNLKLAQVASKLAAAGVGPSAKREYRRTGKSVVKEQTVTPLSLEQALNKYENGRLVASTVGAYTILLGGYSGDARDLRSMAEEVANLLRIRGLPETARCFKGFSLDENGVLRAVTTNAKTKNTQTYHGGPMYAALRDGLIELVRDGLATVEEMVSSNSEQTDGAVASHLQRKVYAVSLTDTGKRMAQSLYLLDAIAEYWAARK